MSQDQELRTRLERAAGAMQIDADRSLEQFHRGRSRREVVRRVGTVALALAVAAIGLSVAWIWIARPGGSHPPAAPSVPTGTIAFMRASDKGMASSVFAAPVDGGTPVAIGTKSYADYPAWSPDGTSVAYGTGAGVNNTALVVARADGGDARRIVKNVSPEPLSWSPDGKRIAYIGDGNAVVHIVGASGTGDRRVIRGFWQSVAWSPDGERLLLTGHPAGPKVDAEQGYDVYTVRLDGTGLARLTHGGAYEGFATWSPGGARILLTRGASFETYAQDVFVMNANGSDVHRLTRWAGFDSFPVWSPDGKWIAFASDRDASRAQQRAIRTHGTFTNISLYVMRANGSGVRRVFTAGNGEALLPGSWTKARR